MTVAPPLPVKIRLRGLSKSFDDKTVLDRLDLDVFAGEQVVVLGGSGSGKSVLLKHMIGLMKPDAGTVEVDGVELGSLRERDKVEARVADCLEMVHLEGAERKMPAELSGGMRRRVGFARAIALEPNILLFDEPTTGLDPVIKAVIDGLILELQEKLNSTAVTITHDLNSAYRIADRIALLFRGKIVAYAPPEEFRRLEDARVQQFIQGLPTGPLSE